MPKNDPGSKVYRAKVLYGACHIKVKLREDALDSDKLLPLLKSTVSVANDELVTLSRWSKSANAFVSLASPKDFAALRRSLTVKRKLVFQLKGLAQSAEAQVAPEPAHPPAAASDASDETLSNSAGAAPVMAPLPEWPNVICDGCNLFLAPGDRYRCADCDDFDYCEACYWSTNSELHHGGHRFVRISNCCMLDTGDSAEDVDRARAYALEGQKFDESFALSRILCDGCDRRPRGRRYISLDRFDFDLCEQCFVAEKPANERFALQCYFAEPPRPGPATPSSPAFQMEQFADELRNIKERLTILENRAERDAKEARVNKMDSYSAPVHGVVPPHYALRMLGRRVMCDSCSAIMAQPSYICTACEDFDLCEACFANGQHEHARRHKFDCLCALPAGPECVDSQPPLPDPPVCGSSISRTPPSCGFANFIEYSSGRLSYFADSQTDHAKTDILAKVVKGISTNSLATNKAEPIADSSNETRENVEAETKEDTSVETKEETPVNAMVPPHYALGLLDLSVICDSCSTAMERPNYICTVCKEFDLCKTCFANGQHEHARRHKFDYLWYSPASESEPADSPQAPVPDPFVCAESDCEIGYEVIREGELTSNTSVAVNTEKAKDENSEEVAESSEVQAKGELLFQLISCKYSAPFTMFKYRNSGNTAWPVGVTLSFPGRNVLSVSSTVFPIEPNCCALLSVLAEESIVDASPRIIVPGELVPIDTTLGKSEVVFPKLDSSTTSSGSSSLSFSSAFENAAAKPITESPDSVPESVNESGANSKNKDDVSQSVEDDDFDSDFELTSIGDTDYDVVEYSELSD